MGAVCYPVRKIFVIAGGGQGWKNEFQYPAYRIIIIIWKLDGCHQDIMVFGPSSSTVDCSARSLLHFIVLGSNEMISVLITKFCAWKTVRSALHYSMKLTRCVNLLLEGKRVLETKSHGVTNFLLLLLLLLLLEVSMLSNENMKIRP